MVAVMSYRVKLNSVKLLMVTLIVLTTCLLWSYVIASRPAVIYSNPQKQPVEVCAGSMMQLTRTLEFTRPLNLTISRTLMRDNLFGETETISLSSISVFRDKKTIHQTRAVYIPIGTPSGNWRLKTYVTSHEFPFWRITHNAPDVLIKVLGECK